MDATREPLLAALCDHYGDPYFAKLLWLKATNYLISSYHQACRHLHLVSRPATLMLDPSNACQLACPGCVHSTNEQFTARMLWPPGVMRPATFETLLSEIGPFALHTVLYNYGEPLLNKWLPEFVAAAHGYGMTAQISTNLSMRFDVERFVEFAPDYVILSIDGASQEAYGRFRKNGNLELVLDNVRRVVEAKRRRGSSRPTLAWRFFTFEHNVHEVDEALRLAREIGVDVFLVGTPFDVSIDDPGVRVATSAKRGRHELRPLPEAAEPPLRALLRRNAMVEQRFAEGWQTLAAGHPEEPARPASGTCAWLYFNQSVDALGRVMPCCISPTTRKRLVFGQLGDGTTEPWNSADFLLSRLAFADREEFRSVTRGNPEPPWCSVCPRQPGLTYDPQNGARDLALLDPENVLAGGAPHLWWELARTWG
ncbi:MAG: radical SAM protein [Deltaproteobacteria bacterium]|nr:radical SAM protein [Deltaproteobacteria bacterium]